MVQCKNILKYTFYTVLLGPLALTLLLGNHGSNEINLHQSNSTDGFKNNTYFDVSAPTPPGVIQNMSVYTEPPQFSPTTPYDQSKSTTSKPIVVNNNNTCFECEDSDDGNDQGGNGSDLDNNYDTENVNPVVSTDFNENDGPSVVYPEIIDPIYPNEGGNPDIILPEVVPPIYPFYVHPVVFPPFASNNNDHPVMVNPEIVPTLTPPFINLSDRINNKPRCGNTEHFPNSPEDSKNMEYRRVNVDSEKVSEIIVNEDGTTRKITPHEHIEPRPDPIDKNIKCQLVYRNHPPAQNDDKKEILLFYETEFLTIGSTFSKQLKNFSKDNCETLNETFRNFMRDVNIGIQSIENTNPQQKIYEIFTVIFDIVHKFSKYSDEEKEKFKKHYEEFIEKNEFTKLFVEIVCPLNEDFKSIQLFECVEFKYHFYK